MSEDPLKYINHGVEALSSDHGGTDAKLNKVMQFRPLQRALVIETLCDPSAREETSPPESLDDTQDELFIRAPRNSLVCRILTNENNYSEVNDIIAYPFFPSHLAFPVKSGEQVWLFSEMPFSGGSQASFYWMSRVTGELEIEDANFTAFTREVALSATEAIAPGDKRKISYPNKPGGDTLSAVIAGPDSTINNIGKSAVESKSIKIEPVPRITKRPGDMVIQGSNNAAIVLGTHYGFDFDTRPDKNENSICLEQPTELGSAEIDIVVGRGRYFESSDDESKRSRKKGEDKNVKNSTRPFVVKTENDEFEVDKNPAETQDRDTDRGYESYGSPANVGNSKTNPSEGDPDILMDASRVLVSQGSNIDKKLGLTTIKAAAFAADSETKVEGNIPSVAIKSDHIRIVARKFPVDGSTDSKLPEKTETDGATNGTIRIVKEGKSDEDLAVIYIEADGTIQISGKAVYVGRTKVDGGEDKGEGEGKSEPYMRFSDFEKYMDGLIDAINAGFQSAQDAINANGKAMSGAGMKGASGGSGPGFGSPNMPLGMALGDLIAPDGMFYTHAGDKSSIDEYKAKKDAMNKIKSKRIFGE